VLLDDCYLPLNAFFQGYRLVVEPAARVFDCSTSVRTEFQRKVRTLAGNWQLLRFFPELLGPRNRLWFDFISYRMGRLLLPFLLLVLAASSFYLPWPWRAVMVAAQALGYLLALVDTLIPNWLPLKRLSSPARTFLVMMAAAVVALQVWFVPARRLWKVTQTPVKGPPAA
jgi:biofilm PGA synthesis N-glycosyltransferase PgaC